MIGWGDQDRDCRSRWGTVATLEHNPGTTARPSRHGRLLVLVVVALALLAGGLLTSRLLPHATASHRADQARSDFAGLVVPVGMTRVASGDGCQTDPTSVCLVTSMGHDAAAQRIATLLGVSPKDIQRMSATRPGSGVGYHVVGKLGSTKVWADVVGHNTAFGTSSPAVYKGTSVQVYAF
jgi:hypothetical protein